MLISKYTADRPEFQIIDTTRTIYFDYILKSPGFFFVYQNKYTFLIVLSIFGSNNS